MSLLGSSLKMIWGLLVVLDTRILIPNKTFFLVEVRGKEFLLGAGNDRIELLSALDSVPEQQSFNEILDQAGVN